MEIKNVQQNEQKFAGFWIRLLAIFLDSLVINACMTFIFMLIGKKYEFFSGMNATSLFTNSSYSYLSTIAQWIYSILMIKYYGATLGKMALRLRVVSSDGDLDWVTIILRETVGKFVSCITLCIGFLMVVWDPKKQAIHDKIAGTYVIWE